MKVKNYLFFVVVLIAMVAASCSKDDVTPNSITANFTYTISGRTVTFTNTSTGGLTYLWTFGDGSTDNSSYTSHTYSAAGSYSVGLTATGLLGATDTKYQSVTVQ
jgi:PKD repeat protein